MKVTYHDQPADAIRVGDEVTTLEGYTFTAATDAEMDQWGDIMIRTTGNRWRTFSSTDKVTISYAEDYDYNMAY